MRIALEVHRLLSFNFRTLQKPFPPKTQALLCRRSSATSTTIFRRPLTLARSICSRAMSSCPPLVDVKDKIDLTDFENKIFDLLLGTLSHFDLHTQLRVAGGWVRDKLLGKECYDIDIAIDNMLGKEFDEKFAEYLKLKGVKSGGVGVIPCNPDQSKHLETARREVDNVWIDFVNLRAEDYSQESRIPTMRFGSAKEDAYRRDLTINSLFYNINTGSVEDLTGQGIADLKAGKIVTPLPPKDTFLDDPLRVLRAIRFGARFQFVLDEELMEAASCNDVKIALAQKISRERIGHEVDLMLFGNQAVKAMTYLCNLKLFWVVFCIPPDVEPSPPEECDRDCVACMDAVWNLIQLVGFSTFSDEQRSLCLYAAMFLPLRNTVYIDGKYKKIPVVNHIFRNSLKLKSSYAETVMNIHNATVKFVSLIPFVISNKDIQDAEVNWVNELFDVPVTSRLRILMGLLLREIKGFWRVALLASSLLYSSEIDFRTISTDKHLQLEKEGALFMKVESEIIKLGLDEVWEEKPLLNGKEIMTILQLKTGGPLVKEWQQKMLHWQLAYPSGTAEEGSDWMKEMLLKRPKLDSTV